MARFEGKAVDFSSFITALRFFAIHSHFLTFLDAFHSIVLQTSVPGTAEYRAAHHPIENNTTTTTTGGAASDLGPGYAQPTVQSQAVGGGEVYTERRDERADYDANPPSGYPVATTEHHKTSVEHPHIVQNPATGEVQEHRTQTGRAMHQAWQDLKQATPGTKEHKAVYPEGSTTRHV